LVGGSTHSDGYRPGLGRPLPLLFGQAARLPGKPATGGITAIG
jgi:hypothetical protein